MELFNSAKNLNLFRRLINMTKHPFRIFAAVAVLALCLTACRTSKPPTDPMVGTWSQNSGRGDLIWDFHPDGTVSVHSWTRTGLQAGVYRHLQDDRVALDFGSDVVSIVQVQISGKQMTMAYPSGTRTVLQKQ